MAQEIEFSTVHVVTPWYFKTALVVTIVFAVAYAVVVLRHVRRGGHGLWRSLAPASLACIPLLINIPVAWVGYLRVTRGMSLFGGGGRAALSAGLAEALSSVLIGTTSTAAIATIALLASLPRLRAGSTTGNAKGAAGAGTRWFPLLVIVAASSAVVITWWFSRHLLAEPTFAPKHVRDAWWGCVISSCAVAVIVLLVARTTYTPTMPDPPWRWHSAMLATIGAVSAVAAILVGHSINGYRAITMAVG